MPIFRAPFGVALRSKTPILPANKHGFATGKRGDMAFETWLFFAFAICVASVSPGPNVLIVVVNAARYGFLGAIWTILGNLTCLFGVALLASVGVGAMISTAPAAYALMKIAGGIYLAWLGIKILRSSFGPISETPHHQQEAISQRVTRLRLFLEAMTVSASNPKSIIFLTAIFPQFLNPSAPIIPQFAVMFTTIIGIVFVIHGTYACLAIYLREKPTSLSLKRWLARLTGTTFVGLGASVAFSR